MKRTLFLLISLYMGLVGANAQSNKYDLNDDGDVNVTDVTLLVRKILAQNEESGYDLNDDEDVNITDVILLVNYILGKDNGLGDTSQAYLTCPDDNHPHLIDLGLPSGTKWACCNVGATIPEGYGGYYAWGETEEKEVYTTGTYLYATGVDEDGDSYYDDWHEDTHTYGVYQNLGNYKGEDEIGISNYDIAGTQYDVAHVKWGGSWVMPLYVQIRELVDNCHTEWMFLNDVHGMRFTGSNGGTIFLPAAGSNNGDLLGVGTNGAYWSSTQDSYYSSYANLLGFYLGNPDAYYGRNYRSFGQSVRPVWKE